MSLSEPVATLLAACVTVPPGIWLGLRTKNAKRDALEKLVAAAVATADQNHKDEIARNDEAHRKEVQWLQSQITYYQAMSAPRQAQRPTHPPVDQ